MSISWTLTKGATPLAVCRDVKRGTVGVVYYRDTSAAEASGDASEFAVRPGHGTGGRGGISSPPNCKLEPLPPSGGQQDVLLVTGPAGSGKSHFLRTYATNYQGMFPDRSVFLVSSLNEDETLDAMPKPPTRLDLMRLAASPTIGDVDKWKNSLLLIDDIEGMTDKQAASILQIQDVVATKGRHNNCSLIRSAHLSTDYRRTRVILSEAKAFVIFPSAGNKQGYMRLLTEYGGMSKAEAMELLRRPDRWLMVHFSKPRYVLSESGISLG